MLFRNYDVTISLKSNHGNYVRMLDDGTVRANASLLQADTKLRFSFLAGEYGASV